MKNHLRRTFIILLSIFPLTIFGQSLVVKEIFGTCYSKSNTDKQIVDLEMVLNETDTIIVEKGSYILLKDSQKEENSIPLSEGVYYCRTILEVAGKNDKSLKEFFSKVYNYFVESTNTNPEKSIMGAVARSDCYFQFYSKSIELTSSCSNYMVEVYDLSSDSLLTRGNIGQSSSIILELSDFPGGLYRLEIVGRWLSKTILFNTEEKIEEDYQGLDQLYSQKIIDDILIQNCVLPAIIDLK